MSLHVFPSSLSSVLLPFFFPCCRVNSPPLHLFSLLYCTFPPSLHTVCPLPPFSPPLPCCPPLFFPHLSSFTCTLIFFTSLYILYLHHHHSLPPPPIPPLPPCTRDAHLYLCAALILACSNMVYTSVGLGDVGWRVGGALQFQGQRLWVRSPWSQAACVGRWSAWLQGRAAWKLQQCDSELWRALLPTAATIQKLSRQKHLNLLLNESWMLMFSKFKSTQFIFIPNTVLF